MKFSLFQESRLGARSYNEDRLGHWRTDEALLLALADGMGGHARGEVAAQIALDVLGGAFRSEAQPRLASPERFLAGAIAQAHARIGDEGRRLGMVDSPRTTVVACVVQAGRAWWSFVGDSRLYLVRGGRVVARTRDHTIVQQLVDAGRIREEAVAVHPDRNKLLRCLGGPVAPALEPAESALLEKGDIVLLCSDGFWGPLTQRQLLMGLIGREFASSLAELVARAEVLAGRQCDNVSVLAIEWQEEAAGAAGEPAATPFSGSP
jgi:serine/threonine protein phosphatase PrpC